MKNAPITRLLVHPVFLSALLSILGFLMINLSPAKYNFEVLEIDPQQKPPFGYSVFYSDLNSDGNSEKFILDNERGYCFLVVLLPNEFPRDQWNFQGRINTEFHGAFTGDYDHDNLKEVACFSLDAGKVILNLIEPFSDSSHVIRNFVVDTIISTNTDEQVIIADCKFHDLNGDHFDELIFSLTAAPERQPRGVYAVDIRNRKIWKTPLAGSYLRELLIVDADGDTHPEIFGSIKASYNYPEGNIFLPDTCAWMIRFDEQLQIKSPPVPVGKPFSQLWPYAVGQGSDMKIQLFHSGMQRGEVVSEFYQLEKDQTLKRMESPLHQEFHASYLIKSADESAKVLTSSLDNVIFSFNGAAWSQWNGRYKSHQWIPLANPAFGPPDIQFAYKMANRENDLMFLNHDGEELGTLTLKISGRLYPFSWIGQFKEGYRFLLTDQEHHYTIEVSPNPWRYLRFLLLPALFAGFYAFISLIRFIQARQIAQREATRREILQLQLKSVRNQLDPHFTFNALNALSSLSLEGNHQGVDHFINHFSRLLRSHLNTADQVLVPLREEIEFVVNFAELQRIRFDNFFRLELDVNPDVDLNRQIPKMLLQTHVENAIKHGLRPCKEAGTLTNGNGRVLIKIRESETALAITIEDNGCGRGNNLVNPNESTGTGLRAIGRIVASVGELYNMEIEQTFEDLLNPDGKPAGTRVQISIH